MASSDYLGLANTWASGQKRTPVATGGGGQNWEVPPTTPATNYGTPGTPTAGNMTFVPGEGWQDVTKRVPQAQAVGATDLQPRFNERGQFLGWTTISGKAVDPNSGMTTEGALPQERYSVPAMNPAAGGDIDWRSTPNTLGSSLPAGQRTPGQPGQFPPMTGFREFFNSPIGQAILQRIKQRFGEQQMSTQPIGEFPGPVTGASPARTSPNWGRWMGRI